MKQTIQHYKAAERGKSEDESFTRLSVFNFENYQIDSQAPFGSLLALNEETLGPKHKIFRHVESDTDIVIIPLAGALLYTDSLGNEDIIETEQIRIFSANDGMSYTLENPYGEDLINYLQVWIKPEENRAGASSFQQKFEYPGKNLLFPIFAHTASDNQVLKVREQARGFLGIFDGQQKENFTFGNAENGLFAFVVNGSFKSNGHVVEKFDGLSFRGVASAEFEAVTENSLLLLIEVPL